MAKLKFQFWEYPIEMKEGLQPRCNTWGETARGSLPMNKFIPLHKQDHTIFYFIVQPLCWISSWILKKKWMINEFNRRLEKTTRHEKCADYIWTSALFEQKIWITKLSRNSTQIDSPISRPQKCHSPHIFLENLIFLILTKIFTFSF